MKTFFNELENINIKIKNIDLGGGLGINYSKKNTLDITKQYTDLIRKIAKRTKKKNYFRTWKVSRC